MRKDWKSALDVRSSAVHRPSVVLKLINVYLKIFKATSAFAPSQAVERESKRWCEKKIYSSPDGVKVPINCRKDLLDVLSVWRTSLTLSNETRRFSSTRSGTGLKAVLRWNIFNCVCTLLQSSASQLDVKNASNARQQVMQLVVARITVWLFVILRFVTKVGHSGSRYRNGGRVLGQYLGDVRRRHWCEYYFRWPCRLATSHTRIEKRHGPKIVVPIIVNVEIGPIVGTLEEAVNGLWLCL